MPRRALEDHSARVVALARELIPELELAFGLSVPAKFHTSAGYLVGSPETYRAFLEESGCSTSEARDAFHDASVACAVYDGDLDLIFFRDSSHYRTTDYRGSDFYSPRAVLAHELGHAVHHAYRPGHFRKPTLAAEAYCEGIAEFHARRSLGLPMDPVHSHSSVEQLGLGFVRHVALHTDFPLIATARKLPTEEELHKPSFYVARVLQRT